MTIKRPQYVVFNDFGQIESMFCKLCGSEIGSIKDLTQGRRFDKSTKTWIEERIRQFRRNSNYAEMKIEFDDGSCHVTNGCRRCMQSSLDSDALNELHNADLDIEEAQGNKGVKMLRTRKALHVLAVRTDGGGIT
jgi:hypothetical protein